MHTPNIDALAAKSLLLKRAYVQQALCSPSRTSMLTGRRPDTTHVYNLDDYFRNVVGNFTTLPQHFKNNGYISAGMGKIYHVGDASGNDDPPSWSEPYFRKDYNYGWETHDHSWQAIPDHLLQNKPLRDQQVVQHAKTTLQKFAKGGQYHNKPFFLAVGFFKPHLPFVFPASFLNYYPKDKVQVPDNQYAPVGMPDVAWSKGSELRSFSDIASLNASGNINTTLPHDQVINLRRAYYSAVSWVDSLVGEVLNELKSLGLKDNTIISCVGDHGWQLGEHGMWCKHTNFDIAAHTPMMLRIPGKTDSGLSTRKLVEFVDLFPTIVEAAGLDPVPLCGTNSNNISLCREGQSFLPLVENVNAKWKHAAFFQYPRHGGRTMGYSVRNNAFRYTEWVKFQGAPVYQSVWEDVEAVELYDHIEDREENVNRANDQAYASVRLKMHDLLRGGWRAASHESTPQIVG